MNDTACALAIRNLAEGRIADATVPQSCSVAAVAQALVALASAPDAIGALGAKHVRVRWRAVDSGIAGNRLRLWHDGQLVLAIEIEAPRPIEGWDALRRTLGEPEARMPYWDGVVENQTGQWVYPGRGLAVFTTLADTEIARVMAFAPTTIAIYTERLARGLEPPREFRGP